MKTGELINKIFESERTGSPLVADLVPVVTVDEDGFVRDVVGVSYDPEAGAFLLRLEIQKKNGEIE